MDATLLDTDVFSYLTKSNDPRADAYPHVKGTTIAISFITVGELYFGAEKKKWSGKTLNNFLERLKAFVVPYDIELCKTYGKLTATLRQAGIVVAGNDLCIAVCAVPFDFLISNNRKHFETISGLIPGFRLISESPEKIVAIPSTKKLFESPLSE
jgi:tRNA(fMet)-specific endonuclease VapC